MFLYPNTSSRLVSHHRQVTTAKVTTMSNQIKRITDALECGVQWRNRYREI